MTPSVLASTHCIIKPGLAGCLGRKGLQVHQIFLSLSIDKLIFFANPHVVFFGNFYLFYLLHAKKHGFADPVTIYAALLNWANLPSCNFKISFMLPWMEVGQETLPAKEEKKPHNEALNTCFISFTPKMKLETS